MSRYLHLPDIADIEQGVGPDDDLDFGNPWDVDVAREQLRNWCFACHCTGWIDGKVGFRRCPFHPWKS